VIGRERVLDAIRRATRNRVEHPGPHPAPALAADVASFAASLAAAGGEALGPFQNETFADAVLARAHAWADGGRIVAEPSAAALLPGASIEIAASNATAHGFADVDVAIARGSVGVAESGAVGVTGRDAPNRALLFLAERVILLLDVAAIAGDLHSALRALPAEAWKPNLTLIAGPSKTADIEQTLVHGAHGPRALAVFLHQTN
jgi:L-lactate dehydrogenase complex protein LldG